MVGPAIAPLVLVRIISANGRLSLCLTNTVFLFGSTRTVRAPQGLQDSAWGFNPRNNPPQRGALQGAPENRCRWRPVRSSRTRRYWFSTRAVQRTALTFSLDVFRPFQPGAPSGRDLSTVRQQRSDLRLPGFGLKLQAIGRPTSRDYLNIVIIPRRHSYEFPSLRYNFQSSPSAVFFITALRSIMNRRM